MMETLEIGSAAITAAVDWAEIFSSLQEGLLTAGAVLFVVLFFGLSIFIHELGHFLVARRRGLHVDAFSIGFKKIWAKKVNGIEYRIGCLPLGGYVELPQIDAAGDPKTADGKTLPPAKPLDRLLTAFAGPFCNVLFGLALGCLVWWFGIPSDTPKMNAIEVAVIDNASPEYAAGLRVGDRITLVNGKRFYGTWQQFVQEVLVSIGEVTLTVERDGESREITYLPAVNAKVPGSLRVERTAVPFFLPRIPMELHPDPEGPAARAGIGDGDWLLAVNGKPLSFNSLDEFLVQINYFGDKPLEFRLKRQDGSEYTAMVQPELIPDELHLLRSYYTGCAIDPELLRISRLFPGFPAEAAGMQIGDKLVAVNDQEIKEFKPFFEAVQRSEGEPLKITVERNGRQLELTMRPKAVDPRSIGVTFEFRSYPSPLQQFTSLVTLTVKSLRGMAVSVGNRLGMTERQSHIAPRNMSGPLGMATVLYRSVRLDLMMGVYFVVMINFALAIFNLLPLPVLDGGHVFFALIEMIFRHPVPRKAVQLLSYLFVGLLILLMLYVSYFDVLRLIGLRSRNTPPAAEKTEQSGSAESSGVNP